VEERGRVPTFGALLRQYRLAAGLSQEALAERARVSVNGISALERGYRRTPQHETLALLAGALALDVEQRREFEGAAVRSGTMRRATSVTVGPWPSVHGTNLPLALKSFVGREAELDAIASLVRDHRLVTIAGAGGLGKTQTALQVGRVMSDGGDGAVCLVAFAPIAQASLVFAAIASALGVQEALNRPLLETVLAYLKNKTLLLILDNCEHVIDQAAIVAEAVLGGCPRVRILATSRESLRAPGEYTYRLPPLRVPSAEGARRLEAANASEYAAIVLFNDRARASDHRFALTDQNAPIVAELCRRVDGIPLAIELAAARVNQSSLETLTEKLDDRFRILTFGERTARPQQQTMRATIDWSYDLLTPPERRIFEQLSVFAGGCTLDTATAVCGVEETSDADVFDLLSSLVDKSLLVLDLEESEPRYRLLESFGQYAREKLEMRGEEDVVAHRHAVAYLALAQRLNRAFYDVKENFFVWAREELDNWRAALEWALNERGDVLLGQRLVGRLDGLWRSVAPVEGRSWLGRALELVDARTPSSVLAQLTYTETVIAAALNEHEAMLASARVAIEHYRVVGDSRGIALAQFHEASALLETGRTAEAQLLLEKALPIARREGNRWLIGAILSVFAAIAMEAGDFDAARGYVAEALQGDEGSKLSFGWRMLTLLGIESRAGNVELALRYATDALEIFQAFNLARGVGYALNFMAEQLILLNRYDEAATSARDALNIAREQHIDAAAANALQHLAAIAALRPRDAPEPATSSHVRAARILGFVNARLARIMGSGRRDRDQQPEYDRVLAVLRGALSADVVAKLMAAGSAMTEEQAVEEALS
jgi:predicted ATPase/transcriptional regulator with XRE-family HTH domain